MERPRRHHWEACFALPRKKQTIASQVKQLELASSLHPPIRIPLSFVPAWWPLFSLRTRGKCRQRANRSALKTQCWCRRITLHLQQNDECSAACVPDKDGPTEWRKVLVIPS